MDPVATIVIPTHDHADTLRASVASALQQTCPVEVFVIGDGVPDPTRAILSAFVEAGHPLRFFDHPKGLRNGEAYRGAALREARGRIVCYLSDDDLYFPDHVETMLRLLDHADFAHAFPVEVQLGGSFRAGTIDLEMPEYRRELLEGRNRIPLSAGAHTLGAYRALELGWSTTPAGLYTDLHMWCKFLRHPGLRFKAARTPTFLGFPAQPRKHLSPADRYQELQTWLDRLSDSAGMLALRHAIWQQKVQHACELDARLTDAIRNGGALTPWECTVQVFFPHPEGYNERDSACFPVRFRTWTKVSVEVPTFAPVFQIRVDPANTPCLIEVARVQVFDSRGELLWQLTPGNAHTVQASGTAVFVSHGSPLRLAADGDDPQLYLPAIQASPEAGSVRLEFMVRLDADLRTATSLLGTCLRNHAEGTKIW